MKLLRVYKAKKDIPEWAAGLYEEKDGAWHRKADVEFEQDPDNEPDDQEDKKERDSFRENNRKMKKQLEDNKVELTRLQQLMGGFQPEDFKKFQEQIAKARNEEEATLLKTGNVDEVVKRRVSKIVEEKDVEIRNRTKAYDELKAKHDVMASTFTQSKAQQKVKSAISKKNLRVRANADDDLNSRISQDWTADENGNLVLRNKELVDDKGEEMDVDTYVSKELLDRRSYFFEPAKGGGAGGSDEGAGGGGPKGGYVARDPLSFGMAAESIAKGEKKAVPRAGTGGGRT